MDTKKRRRRCDHCHKLKHDVKYVVNPYVHDIENRTIKEKFCQECYEAACGDI